MVAFGNLDLNLDMGFKLIDLKCFDFKYIDFRCYFKFNGFKLIKWWIYQIQILNLL